MSERVITLTKYVYYVLLWKSKRLSFVFLSYPRMKRMAINDLSFSINSSYILPQFSRSSRCRQDHFFLTLFLFYLECCSQGEISIILWFCPFHPKSDMLWTLHGALTVLMQSWWRFGSVGSFDPKKGLFVVQCTCCHLEELKNIIFYRINLMLIEDKSNNILVYPGLSPKPY